MSNFLRYNERHKKLEIRLIITVCTYICMHIAYMLGGLVF